MKESPDTLKLGRTFEDSHQMALYASIQNPLVFDTREDIPEFWQKNVPGNAGMNVFKGFSSHGWVDNIVDLAQRFRDIVNQDQDLKRAANRQRGEPGEEKHSSDSANNKLRTPIKQQGRESLTEINNLKLVASIENDYRGEGKSNYYK